MIEIIQTTLVKRNTGLLFQFRVSTASGDHGINYQVIPSLVEWMFGTSFSRKVPTISGSWRQIRRIRISESPPFQKKNRETTVYRAASIDCTTQKSCVHFLFSSRRSFRGRPAFRSTDFGDTRWSVGKLIAAALFSGFHRVPPHPLPPWKNWLTNTKSAVQRVNIREVQPSWRRQFLVILHLQRWKN